MVMVLVVAGCSSSHPSAPDAAADAPPAQLDLDVVVDSHGVQLFTNRSTHFGCDSSSAFPQVGETGTTGDIGCGSGCLTDIALERNGTVVHTTDPPFGAAYLAAELGDGVASTLVITGCGGTASIPVGTQPIPTPTATVTTDVAASTIEVVWDATPEASSAQLWFGVSYGQEIHHVAEHDVTIDASSLPGLAAWHDVKVQALTAPIPIETAFGVVRVWSGNSTLQNIPQ